MLSIKPVAVMFRKCYCFSMLRGDMMTDMIQPFWAIAMLAVAKLEFREIMGWLLLVFFVYFVITSVGFLILPFV